MFATIAVFIFGLALLLDAFDSTLGAPDLFNTHTLMLAGLLCFALHVAGAGAGAGAGFSWPWRRRSG